MSPPQPFSSLSSLPTLIYIYLLYRLNCYNISESLFYWISWVLASSSSQHRAIIIGMLNFFCQLKMLSKTLLSAFQYWGIPHFFTIEFLVHFTFSLLCKIVFSLNTISLYREMFYKYLFITMHIRFYNVLAKRINMFLAARLFFTVFKICQAGDLAMPKTVIWKMPNYCVTKLFHDCWFSWSTSDVE